MTYREMAIEVAKIAGQELVERADELIPNAEGIKDIDIWIRIPSISDDALDIPDIQVNVYPKKICSRQNDPVDVGGVIMADTVELFEMILDEHEESDHA